MRRLLFFGPALACLALAPPAAAEWPTYHGGPALTGYAGVRLGETLSVTARHRVPAAVRVTPVTDRTAVFTAAGSHVLALTPDKGELWRRDLKDTVEASPLVAGRLLVVGTTAGTLFGLDAEKGRVVWKYELGSRIMGSPNLVPDPAGASVVAISQTDGVIHRVLLSDGTRIWVTPRASRCDGSLAVEGGLVVYGNCDAALYFHDAGTGRRTGKVELMTDGQVYAGVAVADGTVYAGDRSGRLYAVDTDARRILWVNDIAGADLSSTPAVSPERVVYGSDDGSLYALSRRDGSLAWSMPTGGRPLSPIIAADKVLAASDGTLFLLDLATGRVLDRVELSDRITSPALHGATVVVGTEEGYVLFLDTGGS